MENRVIDMYTVELEQDEDKDKPLALRCIATNTDDKSPVAVWFSRETTRALLNHMYGHQQTIVDHWMQQLDDRYYADLIARVDEKGNPSRCVLRSEELLPFGFPQEELRPWRDEEETKEPGH